MSGPEQFGKYQLIRKLATGGMAEIFLAKQAGFEDIERFVVIKRVLPHLTENPEFVRMFVDEMRVAAFLSHPNVVQIHDIGAVGDLYFIAMEYMEGRDIRRIMRKAAGGGHVVPLGFALRVVSEVCEGLYYAHNRANNKGEPLNIIHRDVSPQNIMATVQGAIKLLDFGIAKAESQANETRSGVLKGKYSYMSPEQATGQKLDARSDIFALGTILYELTTGRRLFKHENDIVVLKMVAEADVPLPRMIDPGYPPELERIVMKALAPRAGNRYSTCRELQQDILDFGIPLRQLMSAGDVSDYIQELFHDERDQLDPASMPPASVESHVISFMDSKADSVPGTPSFPSLLEQNLNAQDDTSRTGSLSVLLQNARRRPMLAAGVGTAFASVLLLTIVLLTLGYGQATSTASDTPSPNPLIAGTPADAGDDDVVSFGTIAVESTPAGATIFVDGERQDETTPANIPAVTVGDEHFIVAEIEGHTAQAQRISLRYDGDFRTVRFDFEQVAVAPARVVFEGLPEGATVQIDGQQRTSGNYDLQPLVVHNVVVTHRGEELAHEEVTGDPGQEVQINVASRPRPGKVPRKGRDGPGKRTNTPAPSGTGTVVISSDPPTTVYIGRQSLGSTPVRREVPAGSHRLRLVNRGLLINYTESIRVSPGESLERSISIPQGTLRVSARPHAVVTINGIRQGQTPMRKTLYAGRYNVVLSNAQLSKSKRQTVTIRRGSDERIRVDWR